MAEVEVLPVPKLKRDYVGKRVRMLRPVSSYMATVPVGALGTITHQSPERLAGSARRTGSHVKFDACECCGVSVNMTGLAPGDYEFVATLPKQEDRN